MRITPLALLIVVAGVAAARPATAQPPPPRAQDPAFVHPEGGKISLRPDGSTVFNFLPASDLVFEASMAPDVHIVDNLSGILERALDGTGGWRWGYSAFGTFLVKLRMFDEDSNPVRTPSYMPKATVQLAGFRDISTDLDTDEPRRRVERWLIDVIPFGHHSNGQNGCLFNEDARVDGECTGAEAIPVADRTINTDNGSFSTNYLRAGVTYGRLYLESASDTPFAVTRWEWHVGADVELNPTWYPVGGNISEDLHDIYGATRVRLTGNAARLDWKMFGRVEGNLSLEYIHDAPTGVSDVTTRAEVMLLPRKWGGAGLFARFHHGQDYYNLAFFRNVTRLQFGIAFNQAKFLAFRQHIQ